MSEVIITFKDRGVLKETLKVGYHHTMSDLLCFIEARFGKVTVTCGHRDNDSGVHGTNPCRGLDIRSKCYNNPQAVADEINSLWIYDPDRTFKTCALFHDIGQGEHIHLQVHDKTYFNQLEGDWTKWIMQL